MISSSLTGTHAHARDALVMSELAPWVKEDIAIEPRLLTVKDIEDKINGHQSLGEKPIAVKDSDALSPLEKMYSGRVVDPVYQFGYEIFSNQIQKYEDDLKPGGAVQDNFILNTGDEVSVLIRGQKQENQTTIITSEGMLALDNLAPIPAAGRKLSDVRNQLRSEVSRLYNTDVFLSLSKVSQINVIVAGHVKNPGRHALTGLDSIIDALIAAGGIEKTGTLRQIRLIRDDKTSLIDLYGLLIFGTDTKDIGLRNGDRIVVRPIGPSIAVLGDVKRPGIYEILPSLTANWNRPEEKSQKLSMNDLLGFAGGVISPAAHRFLRMDMNNSGEEQITQMDDAQQRVFNDGDILNVVRGKEIRKGTIRLMGNASQPGLHSLSEKETLSALLYDSSVLDNETYPLIGVIERWNRHELAKELLAFSPKAILNGEDDRSLENNDSVYLFSQKEIEDLRRADPQTEIIEALLNKDQSSIPEKNSISKNIRKFLIERSLFVRGAVREPGAYPVAEGVTLDSVLAVAGGTTLEGSLSNVEISSSRNPSKRDVLDLTNVNSRSITLSPGATIRVNQKFRRVEENHVLLIGEVVNPGTYDIQPGDTLGRLIARAGGLTSDSYADGTIFSRQSERKREESRFKSQAQDLELKLAEMLAEEDKDKKPDPQNIATAKTLITQLKSAEALGRITVEADPAMLNSKPQLDILLEAGDKIFVPKRPLTVRVAGEVLSPASLQFRTEKSPRDYINEAGGTSYNADDDRAFVVYPDGAAQPLAVSSWRHNPAFIPPGSTIIVPRDPKPLSFIDGAKDISQILANVATAAIFADDIRDDR